jgi:prepilin signal peptidase PulO-like enzyme (type II secretory pathway)
MILSFLPYLFLFIFGLIFGSFLNVVADRLISGESIIFGRSHCDKCKRILGNRDLVPVLSFILSGGKCRKCGAKLSVWYPLSEILSGLNFILAYVISDGFNFVFLFLVVVLSIYLILFLTDAKYFLISDFVVIVGVVFVLLYRTTELIANNIVRYTALKNDNAGKLLLETDYFRSLVSADVKDLVTIVVSALGIALFFYLLVFLTRGKGMGSGDITLGFLIGLVNGFPNNVLAIFLGFVFGTIYSVPLLLSKSKNLKDPIPFGPFLILGSITALIYGTEILNWYFSLLL